MIELATAAIIAKAASDAVGVIDKIFRGYRDFIEKKELTSGDIPPPDYLYADSPDNQAIVAKSRTTGIVSQTVSYDELCSKLNSQDRKYIETLSRALENYQVQWNAAYEEKSMASGMDRGRLDTQLEFLARQIADPLIKVLDFVEKMGLYLDDHYLMARQVSAKFIEDKNS